MIDCRGMSCDGNHSGVHGCPSLSLVESKNILGFYAVDPTTHHIPFLLDDAPLLLCMRATCKTWCRHVGNVFAAVDQCWQIRARHYFARQRQLQQDAEEQLAEEKRMRRKVRLDRLMNKRRWGSLC